MLSASGTDNKLNHDVYLLPSQSEAASPTSSHSVVDIVATVAANLIALQTAYK